MPKSDPFPDLSGFIQSSVMDDSVPMSTSHSKISTSYASSTVDALLQTNIDKKTAVRFWDNGAWQNGAPNTGDMIIFTDSTTVAGGAGDATFYLTSNHTSGGSALCSTIIQNSVRGGWIDPTGNFNPGAVNVTGNKTVIVNGSKQGNTGVTVLGIGVLATITYPNQPNGTTVTLFAIGISV